MAMKVTSKQDIKLIEFRVVDLLSEVGAGLGRNTSEMFPRRFS